MAQLVSSCDPDQVFVECAEGSAFQKPLGGGAECAETSRTNRIGIPVQEFGSLDGMGAGGGKIAAVQFGRGEIDQNQHPLPTPGRAGIANCCGKHLVCVAVITDPEEDAAGDGGQLRGAVVAK